MSEAEIQAGVENLQSKLNKQKEHITVPAKNKYASLCLSFGAPNKGQSTTPNNSLNGKAQQQSRKRKTVEEGNAKNTQVFVNEKEINFRKSVIAFMRNIDPTNEFSCKELTGLWIAKKGHPKISEERTVLEEAAKNHTCGKPQKRESTPNRSSKMDSPGNRSSRSRSRSSSAGSRKSRSPITSPRSASSRSRSSSKSASVASKSRSRSNSSIAGSSVRSRSRSGSRSSSPRFVSVTPSGSDSNVGKKSGSASSASAASSNSSKGKRRLKAKERKVSSQLAAKMDDNSDEEEDQKTNFRKKDQRSKEKQSSKGMQKDANKKSNQSRSASSHQTEKFVFKKKNAIASAKETAQKAPVANASFTYDSLQDGTNRNCRGIQNDHLQDIQCNNGVASRESIATYDTSSQDIFPSQVSFKVPKDYLKYNDDEVRKMGILVQVKRYKKDKVLPLTDGGEVKVDKGTFVTFFKNARQIYMKINGKIHIPDVGPGHIAGIFKDYTQKEIADSDRTRSCTGLQNSGSKEVANFSDDCPICSKKIPSKDLEVHARLCAENMFG